MVSGHISARLGYVTDAPVMANEDLSSYAVRSAFRKHSKKGDRRSASWDSLLTRVAGARDVRSRQGAWGILSRDLVTRSLSFELALIAAFAPFYNPALYT
jgi:hypothetical protein